MKRASLLLAAGLLTTGCSGADTTDDVAPLPEQTAETANSLMAQAEQAADNAAKRSETGRTPDRSGGATVNEVTP